MKINNLETMEKIVKENSKLFWQGWSVCTYLKEDGFYHNDGEYKDGEWIRKIVFENDGDGWNIPDRFIKSV